MISAQENLVINGGFEDITGCNFIDGAVDSANAWTNLYNSHGSSVDLFNDCNTQTSYSTPHNAGGYQVPAEGSGYVGFIPYGIVEAPIGSLQTALEKDTTYYIEFSISLCDSCSVGYSKLGLAFFDSLVSLNAIFDNQVIPQIVDSSSYIIEKEIWMVIKGLHISNGTERHLAIGYFFDSPNSDSIDSLSGSYGSYYYLDNVVVRKATQTDIHNLRYNVLDFGIYPNPASEVLRLNSKARLRRVLIRDVHGTLVQETKLYGTANELQVSGLPAGVYLIEAYAENGKRGVQRFVKLSDR